MIMTPREKTIMKLEEKLERVSALLVNKYNSALLDSFLNTEKELQIQKCYLSQER